MITGTNTHTHAQQKKSTNNRMKGEWRKKNVNACTACLPIYNVLKHFLSLFYVQYNASVIII